MAPFLLFVLLNLAFAEVPIYTEFGIGFHQATDQFEKYADDGLSMRLEFSVEDRDLPLLRYDVCFDYFSFSNERWSDGLYLSNGTQVLNVDITNSEESFSFRGGIRFMSPTRRAFFRPYVSLTGGLFYFHETMHYDWGGFDVCWDDDCDDDEDTSKTEIIDWEMHLGYVLELGANFYTGKNIGLNASMQYTVVPGLPRKFNSEQEIEYVNEGFISRKINADFFTIYFGVALHI